MPLKKPMGMTLMAPPDEDDDLDNDVGPGLAGLSIPGGSDDDPGASAPPGRALKSQGSFQLSSTMTFQQSDITLKGGRGMLLANGTEASTLLLRDLEKGKRLGSGATSHVYLCKHRTTGERYAMKELTAMADADTRRMAVNELRIARAAQGEHIIRMIDAFFEEGKISSAPSRSAHVRSP